MITAREIGDKLGRVYLAKRLGVSKAAVTNAISDEQFPTRWYEVVRAECAAKGIDCPASLFGFIKPKPQRAEDAA